MNRSSNAKCAACGADSWYLLGTTKGTVPCCCRHCEAFLLGESETHRGSTPRLSDAQNEVKTYDLSDAKTWLREAIGNDGLGEYFTKPEKDAAETVLEMMSDVPRPGCELEGLRGRDTQEAPHLLQRIADLREALTALIWTVRKDLLWPTEQPYIALVKAAVEKGQAVLDAPCSDKAQRSDRDTHEEAGCSTTTRHAGIAPATRSNPSSESIGRSSSPASSTRTADSSLPSVTHARHGTTSLVDSDDGSADQKSASSARSENARSGMLASSKRMATASDASTPSGTTADAHHLDYGPHAEKKR